MNTPRSEDAHSLAAAYALNAVTEDEAAAFERHLERCQACLSDVREMRETSAALAASVAEAPPVGMRERVLGLARSTPQEPSHGAPGALDLTVHRSRRSQMNGWLAGIAAAAVLVAGALGITTFQANQRADELQAASDQVAALLAQPGASIQRAAVDGGGRATLVVSDDGQEAAFVARSLPPAGEDRTYQLWAIDADGATSLGLLSPDAGRATALLELPEGTSAFGMSVEPAGGSEAPTTDPALVLEI